jgi:hypothetical protein
LFFYIIIYCWFLVFDFHLMYLSEFFVSFYLYIL